MGTIDRKDLKYPQSEAEWDDFLDGITADSWGLTLEEFRYAQTLDGEALDEYMKKHAHKK